MRAAVSALKSGLRVASAETAEKAHCCIGLFLPLGSRHEPRSSPGVARAFELSLLSSSEAAQQQQQQQWPVRVTATRDCLSLSVEALRADADAAFGALSNTFFAKNLAARSAAADADDAAALATTSPDAALAELLHEAAFGRDSALGRRSPQGVPSATLARVGRAQIDAFAAHARSGSVLGRAVIAAAGLEHSHLVRLARASEFSTRQRRKGEERAAAEEEAEERGKGFFVGGRSVIETGKAEPALYGPTAHLAHIGIALPSPGLRHPDVHAAMVAAAVLGGGTAFSQGGPGKGMHTRLFRGLLSSPWVEAASAMHAPYTDAGLLGISGACDPRFAEEVLAGMNSELLALSAAHVPADELERAKAMLSASMSMAIEQSSVLCDDIGRQVLLRGVHDAGAPLTARISAVSAEDVRRVVAASVLNSTLPAIAAILPSVPTTSTASHFLPSIEETHRRMQALLLRDTK